MPTLTLKKSKKARRAPVKKRPILKITTKSKRKKPTKLHHLLRLNRKGSINRKFLIFIVAFVLIGGVYMAYRSFASDTLVKADGEFTAITPARILDTRDGTGLGGAAAPVGQTPVTVQITGKGGVPATNVKAVVLNVTVTGGTASSFMSLQSGEFVDIPTSSNINFAAGQTIPNMATVKVSPDGKVKIYNNTGKVHVIFDVAGYYTNSEGTNGSRYHSINPQRVLDTRTATGNINAPVAQAATAVQVTGINGIPTAGVRSVTMNVTVTGPTANSNLTIWPTGEAKPATSNLNFAAGQTIPNLVTVKVGPDGKVNVANAIGKAHVIFDVAGYFSSAEPGFERTQAGRFVPLPKSSRMHDSRTSGGVLGAAQSKSVQVTGINDVPHHESIDAVVANVTVTGGTAGSFLTLWPNGSPRPQTSNLNFAAGETIANQVVVKIGPDGKINAFNNTGSTHFIVDIVGYYKRDLAVATTHAYSGYYYPVAGSKMEHSIKLDTIPNSSLTTQISNSPSLTGIDHLTDLSYIYFNELDSQIVLNQDGQGKHNLRFTCSTKGNTCKTTMPGAIVDVPLPGDLAWYKIPYSFTAGASYKFTYELQRNKTGFPGLWSALYITGPDGVPQQVGTAKISDIASEGYYYGINTQTNHTTSCNTPTPFTYTFSDLVADGSPFTSAPQIVNDGAVFCPGITTLTTQTIGQGKATIFKFGLGKAARDTVLPAIISITPNATKSQVTVKVTDNKVLTQVKVFIDSQEVGYWKDASVYGPDITRQLDTSSIKAGQHTLTVTATDNSGNTAQQIIPFNK